MSTPISWLASSRGWFSPSLLSAKRSAARSSSSTACAQNEHGTLSSQARIAAEFSSSEVGKRCVAGQGGRSRLHQHGDAERVELRDRGTLRQDSLGGDISSAPAGGAYARRVPAPHAPGFHGHTTVLSRIPAGMRSIYLYKWHDQRERFWDAARRRCEGQAALASSRSPWGASSCVRPRMRSEICTCLGGGRGERRVPLRAWRRARAVARARCEGASCGGRISGRFPPALAFGPLLTTLIARR